MGSFKRRRIRLPREFRAQTMGPSTKALRRMGSSTKRAVARECIKARLLGTISPKTMCR